jgi:hypothetical protein
MTEVENVGRMSDRILRCESGSVIAWRMRPGVIWVQAQDTQIAKLLSRQKDCRLVARGIESRYLRTFEFDGKEMAWAEKLLRRLGSGLENWQGGRMGAGLNRSWVNRA